MPIFMIGIQRSGSNLLRLMLNQLPEIAAPHPPHILQRMVPLMSHYGDLSQDANFMRLVEDVCRLVELNPVAWEGIVLNSKDVASRCRERNIIAVHGAVYDICAQAKGAKTWCCKSLANIHFSDMIEAYYKKPKYIYLCRDGRDVAVSFRKAVVGEKHFFHVAKEWTAIQERALKLRDQIEPERFLTIHYEQMTGNPEETARTICAFLGVDYRAAMLDFHQTTEARRAASASALWQNVTSPVMKNNSHKFMREATMQDVIVFESVAGRMLDALSYERVFVKKGEELKFSEADLERFDRENNELKSEVTSRLDPKDRERRDMQAALLNEIKKRPEPAFSY